MTRRSRVPRAVSATFVLAVSFFAPPARASDPPPQPPDRVEAVRFLPAASGPGSALDGSLEVRFEGRHLSRTLVRCLLALADSFAQRNEHGFYNLGLSGEVRRDERPVERFAYRFDVPAAGAAAGRLGLAFDRNLRPGRYRFHLELEDLQSGRRFEGVDEIDVPEVAIPPRPALGFAGLHGVAPTLALRTPGTALTAAEPPGLELLLPARPILVGMTRVAAVARGGLAPARVRFVVDGKPLFTKSRPPFGVELDFGDGASVRHLVAEACDAQGAVVARAERLVNAGVQPFALVLEVAGEAPPAPFASVRAKLTVPSGRRVTRLDYFLGERPFFALEAPPFDQPVPLPPGGDTMVVRALARLSDGRSAEDVALLHARDVVDETSVRLVELYVAVVDRRGRSVGGLARDDFRVAEDGRPQPIVRFDSVDDLPLHLALVLDVSASMRPQLASVSRAATDFLRRAVTPADRASLITFNDSPRVAVEFTGDFDRLANGLDGLRADGRTEIQRALELALGELEGVPGQRAVLLFSDGVETNPRDARALVEYARRGGVALYTVGFGIPADELAARLLLTRLAEETGGRALFVRDVEELELAYAAIVREMRSRYLVAYQSDNPDGSAFRTVDVALVRRGLEVRAPRGYYP